MADANTCVFEPLSRADLPLVAGWLARPHVRAAFGDPAEWMAEIGANLGSDWVRHFRADLDDVPAGFVQVYDARKAPPGPWSSQPAGTFGLDFLLGEPALLGRGLGRRLVAELAAFAARAAAARRLIMDPDPANRRSVRAAEAAGFVHDRATGLWVKEIPRGGP